MTIDEYRRVFRERWLTIVLAVLLGLGGGAAVHFLRPPKYTAFLQMYISTRVVEAEQSVFQSEGIAARRAKSYVELASSPRVTSEVAEQLGLQAAPGELASRITAANTSDSVIIDLFAVDGSPEQAAAIVNATSRVLSGLVDELERGTTSGGVSPVVVQILQPAAVPTVPSGRGLLQWLILGMLGGVVLGVAISLIRNAADHSIKSMAQLREVSGVPNLGMIAFDTLAQKRPLIVHEEPQSLGAEAFRQLRTNVQFVDIEDERKILALTSPMAGEGKTTTLVNLAIALAAAGESVLIVEADLRKPKVAEMLGLGREFGLTNAIAGLVPTRRAIQKWKFGAIDLLASGPLPPNPSEMLANPRMAALLDELRNSYDVILIDTPALVSVTDAATIAAVTDGAILLCRFHETTRLQVQAAIDALDAVAAPILGSVFTMTPTSEAGTLDTYHQQGGNRPADASRSRMRDTARGRESDPRRYGRAKPGRRLDTPPGHQERPPGPAPSVGNVSASPDLYNDYR